VTLPALLARILDDSGIYAVYGGIPEGEQCLANVEKFVNMAREAGDVSLASFVAEMKRFIDEGEREAEVHLDPTATNAVSVMTFHAAKGLEFPIFYFTALDRFVPVEVDEDGVLSWTVRAVEWIKEARFSFPACEGCGREGECPSISGDK